MVFQLKQGTGCVETPWMFSSSFSLSWVVVNDLISKWVFQAPSFLVHAFCYVSMLMQPLKRGGSSISCYSCWVFGLCSLGSGTPLCVYNYLLTCWKMRTLTESQLWTGLGKYWSSFRSLFFLCLHLQARAVFTGH